MHPPLINNVSQMLNLGHAKSAFLQIGTQLVLSQCLEDLLDVVEVLFLLANIEQATNAC
jgi:hypothetical protein